MDILNTFELIETPDRPFITVSKYGISFSQLSLKMLHYSRFVHVFIDRDSKKLAIQECGKDASAIELVHENKADSPSVRWGNRKLLRIVKELSGKDINTSGIRFTGEFHEAEKLIIFNLNGEEEHEVR